MPTLRIHDRRTGQESVLTCTDLEERDQLVERMVESIERDPAGARGEVERIDDETVAIRPVAPRLAA